MGFRKAAVVVGLVALLAGCGGAPAGNDAKCKSIGGTYNSATRSCVLQAE